MKHVFINILICVPYFILAQLHDTLQRSLLKEYGLRKIEKLEVISSNDSFQFKLFSTEVVNKDGYTTSIKSFDENGKLFCTYDHNYSDDNLLLESIVIYDKIPSEKKQRVVYTYKDSKFPETFSYYENYELLTAIEYTYDKAKKVKKEKQVWYNRKGKKTGEGKSVYKYDRSGKLLCRIVQSKINGESKKITYTFKIDTILNSIETYLKDNDDKVEFLLARKIKDSKDRLIDEYTYSKNKTKYTIQGRSFEVIEGEVLHKNYIYDNRGLIEKEIITASNNQRLELVYKYSK